MYAFTVLYPYSAEESFDMDYYRDKHIPYCKELLGDICKGVYLDFGVGSMAPGQPPAFHAVTHMLFSDREAFMARFQEVAASIVADGKKATNIKALSYIGTVELFESV